MTQNMHITRNFDANRTNIIRMDGEKFRFEIFKYDKVQDMMYTALNPETYTHNGATCWWDGMTGLKRNSTKNLFKLKFKYDAKSTSDNYRIELLYSNTYKIGKSDKKYSECYGSISINGKMIMQDSNFVSNDMTYNRYQQYCHMDEGINEITVELSQNMVFYGLIIRRFYLYESHYPLLTSDQLVPISAEVSHTDEFRINTMTCSFMYNHSLDEKLLPTDENANRSGLVFDYRDEINWYVTRTDGVEEQVFGGYISTATVDEKLTTLSIECADRVIDLDRRYCMSEILMNGASQDEKTKYTFAKDCLKTFDYYSDAIEFLCNHSEVPIINNITMGKSLIPKKAKVLRYYKKGKTEKLTDNNMDFFVKKNKIQIRNGINRNKEQSLVIYNSDKGALINSRPNLFIEYGLGEEEYEEEVIETTIITTQKGISQSVTKQAEKSAKGVTGANAVKPLWRWIVNNIKHNSKTSGFYQTPAKTLSTKKGNCCCKSELLLDMCNYKGVTDLQYVHVKPKGGGTGHVFCKINGKIVDPSTSNGWGSYYKKQGTLANAKYTTYPTKPF